MNDATTFVLPNGGYRDAYLPDSGQIVSVNMVHDGGLATVINSETACFETYPLADLRPVPAIEDTVKIRRSILTPELPERTGKVVGYVPLTSFRRDLKIDVDGEMVTLQSGRTEIVDDGEES